MNPSESSNMSHTYNVLLGKKIVIQWMCASVSIFVFSLGIMETTLCAVLMPTSLCGRILIEKTYFNATMCPVICIRCVCVCVRLCVVVYTKHSFGSVGSLPSWGPNMEIYAWWEAPWRGQETSCGCRFISV